MLALLQEASIFAGRYRVGRCIASGGMGAVYAVQHVETERQAALKVLLPHVLANDSAREQFKAEARVAAKLRSEHIVDVLDAGVDVATDMPYLVMELLEGEDLGARVHRVGPLPPDEAVLYLDQVARALDRLHARSIIHRDLKPENLFLTERDDGSPLVKVLDFGIAKVLAGGTKSALTDQARGTPIYMSPEQFRHAIKISAATDIYSLGMVAFTLLAGDPYWGPELDQGMNVFVIARLAEAGPKDPASVRAAARGVTLPPAFDAWFARVTSPDPEARHPRAAEAVQALADALGVLPARADRPSFFGRESRPGDDATPASPAVVRSLTPESPSSRDVRSSLPREPPPSRRGDAPAPPSSAPAVRVVLPRGSSARHDVPTLPNAAGLRRMTTGGRARDAQPADRAAPLPAGAADAPAAPRHSTPADHGPASDGHIETGMSPTGVDTTLPPPGQRDRAGKLVLAAALAAALLVLLFLVTRGSSGVSTAALPAFTTTLPEPTAPAASATTIVTVIPAPSGTIAPAADLPAAAVTSSSNARPAASANVTSSPAGAPPSSRPSREGPGPSTPVVPPKKQKYTQD